jgi:hypothetical protein
MTVGAEVNLSGVGAKRRRLTESGQSSSFVYNDAIRIEGTQERRIEYEIGPNAPIEAGSPWQFDIGKEMDTFLDMGSLSLTAELKIVKPDGSDCADTDIVAPVNLLASSLWERVEVKLNQVMSNQSSADYFHYKSFLETILSYEGDARETHLMTQLFKIDTPGQMDNFTKEKTGTVEPNAGFVYRHNYTKNSKKFDVVCPLATDILRCSKFLVPGVALSVRLHKAPDRWLLMTSSNVEYKIKVLDLKLEYARIKLFDPDYKIEHIQQYPFPKTEMRKYPVQAGAFSHTLNIGNEMDRIPKQIYFFMVKATTSEGNYKANSFNFEHFDIVRHRLKVKGESIPNDGITFDFSSDPPLQNKSLARLYKHVGVYRTDRGCCITHEGYSKGQFVIAYDLSPDLCNGHHLHLQRVGSLVCDFFWKTGLPEAIHIYAHMVFDCEYTKDVSSLYFDLAYV